MVAKKEEWKRPIYILVEDLLLQIEEWRTSEKIIIIMVDLNIDVMVNLIREWKESLGLRDVVLDTVGKDNAPSTYDKGSHPTNSIMCSANISILKVGYLPFSKGAGGHMT